MKMYEVDKCMLVQNDQTSFVVVIKQNQFELLLGILYINVLKSIQQSSLVKHVKSCRRHRLMFHLHYFVPYVCFIASGCSYLLSQAFGW